MKMKLDIFNISKSSEFKLFKKTYINLLSLIRNNEKLTPVQKEGVFLQLFLMVKDNKGVVDDEKLTRYMVSFNRVYKDSVLKYYGKEFTEQLAMQFANSSIFCSDKDERVLLNIAEEKVAMKLKSLNFKIASKLVFDSENQNLNLSHYLKSTLQNAG